MSKHVSVVVACLALALTGATDLAACGDKYLVGLRGGATLRFADAVQPARILVYWNSDDPESTGDAFLEQILEEAGHEVTIVKDSESLYEAAASRRFDVITMEIGDARDERSRLKGVSPHSTILPVLYMPNRREKAATTKEFGHWIDTPTTTNKLLRSIEQARPAGR